ncbi:uncharacterized protein [Diadema setosum]|uniref:uncharacterized protein n=1 Tax=Diadema setosum TaxID=31175 RepID=UPI003B3B7D6E
MPRGQKKRKAGEGKAASSKKIITEQAAEPMESAKFWSRSDTSIPTPNQSSSPQWIAASTPDTVSARKTLTTAPPKQIKINAKVGSRVIRGVDWMHKNQDGGPGHVGTVIAGHTAGRFLWGPQFPPFTVLVQWDVGNKGLYRIGLDRAWDLRELHIPITGKVHNKIWCDGCNKSEIQGFRWRCTECYGIDLCTDCYMGDKHDIRHVFMRVECSENSSMGEKVPPRCKSSFSPIYGFFPGAKVVKFPSWVQRIASDTVLGKIVASSRAPEMGQECRKATVEFRDGVTSQVHCGLNGKVDIMCTFPGQGGEIYESHMPNLGNADPLKIGDKVALTASFEESRRLQQRRALPELSPEILGKVGVVTQRSEQDNFAVNFKGCPQTVWLNPFVLTKLDAFYPGQTVLIIGDGDWVTRAQGRGSKSIEIKEFLRKIGRVTKIMPDGDVQVVLDDNRRRVFKAVCLMPFCPGPLPEFDSSHLSAAEVESLAFMQVYSPLVPILMAAKKGNTHLVNRILDEKPEMVEYEMVPGMTLVSFLIPYDRAMDVMKLLVDRGAFIEGLGGSFPTPLMRAVQLNKTDVVDLLLRHGADVNLIGERGMTSLHIAVELGHFQCVHYLLLHNADVNSKLPPSSFGFPSGEDNWTPLHFAAATRSESRTVVDLLTARKETDFKATSSERQGAEAAVHLAARHDNLYAMRKLLERVPRLSMAKTVYGETALHIAAQHNSVSAARYLIEQATCELNLQDKAAGNTPLMMALGNLQLDVTEILLRSGASCNIQNRDGITSLHMAVFVLRKNARFTSGHEGKPFIREMKEKWGKKGVKSTGDALVAYLVSHGGDLHCMASERVTIRSYLETIRDPILPALETIERQRRLCDNPPISRAKQTKNKQKSSGNKKEKSSNPQPASGTSATTGFQRLRKVSEPVEQDGIKLDLADLVRSRQMSKGNARKVRAEDESPSETAHKSVGASGCNRTPTSSADNIQPDGSTASRSSPTDSEVITKLKTKLRDLEKEADSLRRDLRLFDHLTEMRISFACGHDVIKSVADLVPDCPSCRGKLTGIVLHTSDGSDDIKDS